MAPRRKVLASKRREAGPSEERRSKRREDRSVSPPPPPQAPQRQVISMANRLVTMGRRILFNVLSEEGFNIGDFILKQGWEDFCSLNLPTYPNLIRAFFEQMQKTTCQLISNVKGVLIALDETVLGRIIKCPDQGLRYFLFDNKKEALRNILGRRDVKGITNLSASQLNLEMRLLHNFVGRIFFPKTGRFDLVSERDIMFMHHLIQGTQMNLPFMMLNQMYEATRKARACLPYGMIFTLIFREFNVPLEGEDLKFLHHTDTYTTKSFSRMGYVKVKDQWVKKTSGQRVEHSDSEEEEEEEEEERVGESGDGAGPSVPTGSPRTPPPHSAAPPAPSAAFSEEILSQITDRVTERMSTLLTQFRDDLRLQLTETTGGLQSSIDGLRQDIQRLTGAQADFSVSFEQSLRRMETMVGSCSSTGPRPSQPSSSVPAPTPIARPPFSATFRHGIGFPPPQPPRVGPASRTRSSPGPSPIRSSRIMAPQTLLIPDQSDSEEEQNP